MKLIDNSTWTSSQSFKASMSEEEQDSTGSHVAEKYVHSWEEGKGIQMRVRPNDYVYIWEDI